MKSLVSFFLFILLQLWLSQAQLQNLISPTNPTDYTPIDPSQVEANPQIQGLLYLGVQNAIQQALLENALPQAIYKVSQILGIAQNLNVVETQDYKFDVELTDGHDTPIIIFYLSYDPVKGTSEVTSYNAIPDDYTDLDPSVIETNPMISAILDLGIETVTSQAIEKGALPAAVYQLEDVNRVEQSKINPNQYRFDVDLEASSDDDIDDVRALFSLVYRREIGNVEILYYTITDDDSDSESDNNENEEGLAEFIEGETEVGVDGFVVLDTSIADNDPLIRGILFFGVQEAIQQAIETGSLSNSTYELAGIHSIEQSIDNPDNYKFDVSVRNASEDVFRMDLDVLYDEVENGVEVVTFGILSAEEILERESSLP